MTAPASPILTSDKWVLSAVSVPLRRGTASRLGLRTPTRFATGGVVTTGYLDFSACVLTPKQEQELRAAFEYAQRSARPGLVVLP